MKWLNKISPRWAYLALGIGLALILWHLQATNDRNACENRNLLRVQINQVAANDVTLREEVIDYLELRLAGDRSKIAEGVRPLKQTIQDLEGIPISEIELENC